MNHHAWQDENQDDTLWRRVERERRRACVDENVPLAWGDKAGSYDWVATMRDYLGWKSVHQPGLVNMQWNKSSTPPPALRDHVCWYGE